jgi:hypothetical protein
MLLSSERPERLTFLNGVLLVHRFGLTKLMLIAIGNRLKMAINSRQATIASIKAVVPIIFITLLRL